MTVSRHNNRRFSSVSRLAQKTSGFCLNPRNLFASAFILSAVFVPANPSLAQQNAPLRLAPTALVPNTATQPAKKPAPAFKRPPSTPPSVTSAKPLNGAIEINSLQEINPDSGGVLNADQGGFGIGLWKNSKRSIVERLIKLLPVNAPSPAMRDIMRRLLLSTSVAPIGDAAPGSLMVLRIQTLASMGDRQGTIDLINLIRGKGLDKNLIKIETDALFLATDNARACAIAAQQIQKTDADFWQKAFVFCQILSGDVNKAQLGASLMQEANIKDDVFYQLVDSFNSGQAPVISTMPNPTPLNLAMSRAAKAALPVDAANSDNSGILRAIAMSPNASKGLRLEAAERAEAGGALSVDALRQLYNSVQFSDEDLANPLSRADVEFGPTVRALLYHSALIQTVPTARAEAMARAFELARQEGRYPSTVRVFLPILKQLPPSRDLLWFAPEVVRALLFSGDFESADIWYQVLKSAASFDAKAKTDLALLLPAAVLIGFNVDETISDAPANNIAINIINNWKRAALSIKTTSPDTFSNELFLDQSMQLFTLFDAFEKSLPDNAWLDLIQGTGRRDSALPNPAILFFLDQTVQTLINQQKPSAPLASTGTPLTAQITAPSQPTLPLAATTVPTTSTLITSVLAPPSKTVQTPVALNDSVVKKGPPFGAGQAILLSMIAIGEQGPGKTDAVILGQIIKNLRLIGLDVEARKLAVEAILAWGL